MCKPQPGVQNAKQTQQNMRDLKTDSKEVKMQLVDIHLLPLQQLLRHLLFDWQIKFDDKLKTTATAGGEQTIPYELNIVSSAGRLRAALERINTDRLSVPFSRMFQAEPKSLTAGRFKKCTDGYETHACCNPQVIEHSYVIN